MNKALREWLEVELRRVFRPDTDFPRLCSWFEAALSRKPLVIVGAGLSLNAKPKAGGVPPRLPLWGHLMSDMADEIGAAPGDYDALTLAELFQDQVTKSEFYRKLLARFPDEDVEPGASHGALASLPFEAVVTTNQLDTLLDRALRGVHRVALIQTLITRARCGVEQVRVAVAVEPVVAG